MKNTLIILLVIVLVAIGGVLYFYRDAIFSASSDTTDAAGSAIENVQEDVVDGVKDVKDTLEK